MKEAVDILGVPNSFYGLCGRKAPLELKLMTSPVQKCMSKREIESGDSSVVRAPDS